MRSTAVTLCAALLGAAQLVDAQAPESLMVVEAHSGRILLAAEANRKRPVASLTKIATGVVALDWAKAAGLQEESVPVIVPSTAVAVGGPNPMNLQPGDRLSLRDALYSALLGSDNIAALAAADTVGRRLIERDGRGSEPVAAFVEEMNKLAKALAMRDTQFSTPHGLTADVKRAHSTAADMARLSIYAMRRPAFSFMVRQTQRTVTVETAAGPRSFKVKNTNELLGEQGVTGIKTGATATAGPCLATCVERDPLLRDTPDGNKLVTPRRLVVVVLGSPDRFGHTRSLIRQGWSIYDRWTETGSPSEDPRREFLQVPDPR
jgi:D-alanyl-D-alanine carboxypeptidase (penicillin-binding protein 5/6)